jgi:hypothetical protein
MPGNSFGSTGGFSTSQIVSSSGAGADIGSIVSGNFAGNPKYLLCDGAEYVKTAYPSLNTTGLETFGSNLLVARTLPTSQTWAAVAYGNGVFVMVGATSVTGSTTICATSTDGVTWTQRTIPSGAYHGVVYGAGLFVAVSYSGTISTSPDGITWTSRSSGMAYGSLGGAPTIAYGNGMFVVMYNGVLDTNNYAMTTSPDGINWTPRYPGYSMGATAGVTFDGIRFWAGYNTTAISSSFDGVIWKYYTQAYAGVPQAGSTNTIGVLSTRLQKFKNILLAGPYKSYDNGETWPASLAQSSTIDLPNINQANGIAFALASNGQYNTHHWSPDLQNWKQVKTSGGGNGIGSYTGAAYNYQQIAYGNGIYVFAPGYNSGGATSAVCYTLAPDTTKFRTPYSVTSEDTGRYYLKVA